MSDLLNLSKQEIADILFKAIKQGGKVLTENTRELFLARHTLSNTTGNNEKLDVNRAIHQINSNSSREVIVSIMGDYRVKFFEKGTKERYTKSSKIHRTGVYLVKRHGKGRYTGRIQAEYFFRQARNNTEPIFRAINQSIDKQLK